MKSTVDQEHLQRAHYDAIAEGYELHYSDQYSTEYRRRFFFEPMTGDIDVSGLCVLDAMCGSGQMAEYLAERGAHVTGLDISPKVMELFREKLPQCTPLEASILSTGVEDDSFDCVFVVGGLHHLHPYLDTGIGEMYRILKPGGYLCFAEPHAGSVIDLARRFWYKHDDLFGQNEAAIDLDQLEARNAGRFQFVSTRYWGNVAYIAVFNSMVLRVPLWLKRCYAPPFLGLERLLNRVCGKRFSCFVVCQWKKLPASVGSSSQREDRNVVK